MSWAQLSFRILLGFTTFASASFASSIWDYGAECYRELGAPVRPINCNDPSGTRVPVTVNGTEVNTPVDRCDRPAHVVGDKACQPDTRIFKYTDTVRLHGRNETVTTVVMCRKKHGFTGAAGTFHDIGIIQHNETSNKSCWFFMEDTGAGKQGTSVPPPFVPHLNGVPEQQARTRSEDYWANPEATAAVNCINCHNSSMWIRTPYLSQTRVLPDNPLHGPVTHVGAAFQAWNANPPKRIEIQRNAYDQCYPRPAPPAGVVATPSVQSGYCTSCHFLASNSNRAGTQFASGGSCGDLLKSATGRGGDLSETRQLGFRGRMDGIVPPAGRTNAGVAPGSITMPQARALFARVHWMPPNLAQLPAATPGETPQAWLDRAERSYFSYYGRALEAVQRCCENPNLKCEGVSVCEAPPPAPGAAAVAPLGLPAHVRADSITH